MDDVGDGENQLVCHRLLPQFPIHPGTKRQRRRLGKGVLGDDTRPHRGEPIQPLAKVPLLVPCLQVPGRHIVDDGVSKHIVKGDILGVPP